MVCKTFRKYIIFFAYLAVRKQSFFMNDDVRNTKRVDACLLLNIARYLTYSIIHKQVPSYGVDTACPARITFHSKIHFVLPAINIWILIKVYRCW